MRETELGLSFKGRLHIATVARIFEENLYVRGEIAGNLEGRILFDRPAESTAF
jgi:hypothetical protein